VQKYIVRSIKRKRDIGYKRVEAVSKVPSLSYFGFAQYENEVKQICLFLSQPQTDREN